MPNTLGLYPNSAPDGTPIPLDIFWPIGTIPINGTAGVAQNGITLGTPVPDIILVYSKVDCYIQFGANFGGAPAFAVKQANGCIFIPANYAEYIPVYPDEATTFSIWPLASGLTYLILCTKWKDTKKSAQFART